MGRVDRKEGGWGGVDGKGEEKGWMAMGRGNLEGRNGEGDMLRGAILTGRGWQWGGGREEEMERGAMGKGGRWGRRQSGGGKGEIDGDGEGEKKGQEEGRFHRWI